MITTIHQTDLFRLHNDPDDHWDLACQFALQEIGLHHLAGIMIDKPPERGKDLGWQPDINAVAQMNFITKSSVPMGVGAPDSAPETESGGSNLLLTTLRNARDKVTIHIVGSCRDVAVALKKEPALFAAKCAGIYLNAGSGIENGLLEWNVSLDPAAYSTIFSAECPLYWMPCFENVPDWEKGEDMTVGIYGTFYRFRMGEILTELSKPVQNFFLCMLNRETSSNWLQMLEREVDPLLLEKFGAMDRNMWCTGGFLYAVGRSVSVDGEIVSKDSPDTVYRFLPVRVSCSNDGHTTWESDPASNHYIYTVTDTKKYPIAMMKAMRSLLAHL